MQSLLLFCDQQLDFNITPANTHFYTRYAKAWAIHAMLTKSKTDARAALPVYEDSAKKAKGQYNEEIFRTRRKKLRELVK